jgi:hypothetical protein
VSSAAQASRLPGEGDAALALVRGEIGSRGVVFNDPLWARVVSECYGFADCSASADGGTVPLFLTTSPLLGRKLVSAVYNSYASPLFRDAEACAALVDRAIACARARDVAYLELKCLFPLPADVAARFGLVRRERYRATFVPLAPARMPYGANFRRNLRRASRAMRAAGARIERTAALGDLESFYALMVRRYRDKHAMIPQPWRLFEILHRRFLRAGRGDLWAVRAAGGAVVAGVVCLRAGAVVTACYGACDDACGIRSVDAVLKDAMMTRYAEEGARVFDMGITSPLQKSVQFAKDRFGGVTVAVPTYYFPVRAQRIPDLDYADAYLWARRPFRWVPLWMIRRVSRVIVPYLN